MKLYHVLPYALGFIALALVPSPADAGRIVRIPPGRPAAADLWDGQPMARRPAGKGTDALLSYDASSGALVGGSTSQLENTREFMHSVDPPGRQDDDAPADSTLSGFEKHPKHIRPILPAGEPDDSGNGVAGDSAVSMSEPGTLSLLVAAVVLIFGALFVRRTPRVR